MAVCGGCKWVTEEDGNVCLLGGLIVSTDLQAAAAVVFTEDGWLPGWQTSLKAGGDSYLLGTTGAFRRSLTLELSWMIIEILSIRNYLDWLRVRDLAAPRSCL